MFEFLHQWRFSVLLLALIANILFAPLFGAIWALTAFTVLLIIIALVLCKNRIILTSYVLLAVITLVLTYLHIINTGQASITSASHFFSFIVLLLAIALIIANIFSYNIVTADTIAESLCAYLLLGFAFAHIYALIDIISPNSFMSSLSNEFVTFEAGLDGIYFSFITLLTVGYGDIVPVSHTAKLTTIIEGFLGQIYLVVLIARLVGMHVSQNNSE